MVVTFLTSVQILSWPYRVDESQRINRQSTMYEEALHACVWETWIRHVQSFFALGTPDVSGSQLSSVINLRADLSMHVYGR